MNNRIAQSFRARVVVMLGVLSAAVMITAARAQTPVAGMQPPAKPVKLSPKVAVDSPMTIGAAMEAAAMKGAESKADSLQLAGASAMGDSMHMAAMIMPTPVVARPKVAASWPTDPRTGQTLINGVPVVGRVFVQKKVDGIVAYRYADVYAGEPSHPLAPVVKSTYRKPPLAATRRVRGIMVEATLWGMDRKRAARMNQHWR